MAYGAPTKQKGKERRQKNRADVKEAKKGKSGKEKRQAARAERKKQRAEGRRGVKRTVKKVKETVDKVRDSRVGRAVEGTINTVNAVKSGNIKKAVEGVKKTASAFGMVNPAMGGAMMSNMPPQPSNVMGVAQPVFNPSAMAAASNMFGDMQMRQNAAGAPPVFKKSCGPLKQRNLGNYGGYEKTNVGDLIDETTHDDSNYKVSGGSVTSGKNYNVQDLSEIQEDNKSQFMTTLAEDEYFGGPKRPGVNRDTLRPATGKYFYKPKK